MYFLVNASSPYPWDVATSNFAIDMKHNKRDFSLKAWWVRAPGVDLGSGTEAKIKLFRIWLYASN